MYLARARVRLTGIDGWSWDTPFVYTARNTPRQGRQSDLGRHKAVATWLLPHRKLHTIEQLPSTGFTSHVFR